MVLQYAGYGGGDKLGLVGIGTSVSDGSKLRVKGDVGISGELKVQGNGKFYSTDVKVHAPSHGFTTSDTVMFWSATNSGTEGSTTQFHGMGVQGTDRFGVAPSELESASGYTPTPDTTNVTPDGPDLKSNFFTITISSTPTATGYGGGGLVFVGPITVSA